MAAELLLVWLSDGGHSARLIPLGTPLIADAADPDEDRLVKSWRCRVLRQEMIHLPFGQNMSGHLTIELGVGESKLLEFLRFDCNHQYPGRCRIEVIYTYQTQHDVPNPIRRLSSHSSAQAR